MTTLLHDWVQWLPEMLSGLRVSLLLTATVVAVGFPLGLLLAVGVLSPAKVVKVPVLVLVEIGRGAPILVVLYFFYFGLPNAGLTLSSYVAAACGLIVTAAAYSSEYFRSGLQSVPPGEVEAALALGMGRGAILRHVVVPQGLRIAVPQLLGQGIQVFQGTALAFSITVTELMSRVNAIGALTFEYFSVFLLAGCLYLVVTIPASWLVHRLERRMSVYVRT